VRLKNITHATLYVLRNDYGTGKRGDFVGAVVDNRGGRAVVSTLLNRNDQPRAPDLLDKKDSIPPDDINAILAEMKKEEEAEEIQRTELASRQRALVLFPTRHGWGFASRPAGARRVARGLQPAKVMIMSQAEAQPPAPRVAAAPPAASRYASAPSMRSLSRPYAASAPPAMSSSVKPPQAYARPALYASRGSGSPYTSIGPRTAARGYSPPRAQYAAASSSGSADPPPPYRTASAGLTSSTTLPRPGPTSVRRRVPLRMPVREERLSQAVPGSRPAAFVEAKPSPVRVTRSLVREVQRRLKRQGYSIGKVDGSLGRRTSQAIRRFQRDVSLHPTGRIDRRLVASLGMDADNGWSKKSVARTPRVRKPRVAKRWRPTKTHVKEVQQRLALIGYRPGTADGVYGRQTARAVKRFQRQVGLKATGRIDRKVLHRLSIKP
jgi:peptidoglycan hydrolase-like protein with peptidoglycan-binding domain